MSETMPLWRCELRATILGALTVAVAYGYGAAQAFAFASRLWQEDQGPDEGFTEAALSYVADVEVRP